VCNEIDCIGVALRWWARAIVRPKVLGVPLGLSLVYRVCHRLLLRERHLYLSLPFIFVFTCMVAFILIFFNFLGLSFFLSNY
jgi:hypothetical protein